MPLSVAWMLLAAAVVWALYTATRGSDWLGWTLVAGQFVLASPALWMAGRDRRSHRQIDARGEERQPS
jgi:hypothetical protein